MLSQDGGEQYWRFKALNAEMRAAIAENMIRLRSTHYGSQLPVEVDALRARIAQIEASRSWKITRPLRAFMNKVYELRARRAPVSPTLTARSADDMALRISNVRQFADERAVGAFHTLLSQSERSS
tara:strand:+ start:20390 stop:20767 length:378 start_codon:yes stop_codon:yes gene_type:complete